MNNDELQHWCWLLRIETFISRERIDQSSCNWNWNLTYKKKKSGNARVCVCLCLIMFWWLPIIQTNLIKRIEKYTSKLKTPLWLQCQNIPGGPSDFIAFFIFWKPGSFAGPHHFPETSCRRIWVGRIVLLPNSEITETIYCRISFSRIGI